MGGGGGPRPQNGLIYNFPFEIEHCVVRNALSFLVRLSWCFFVIGLMSRRFAMGSVR